MEFKSALHALIFLYIMTVEVKGKPDYNYERLEAQVSQ